MRWRLQSCALVFYGLQKICAGRFGDLPSFCHYGNDSFAQPALRVTSATGSRGRMGAGSSPLAGNKERENK